jgi:hypothetical protein
MEASLARSTEPQSSTCHSLLSSVCTRSKRSLLSSMARSLSALSWSSHLPTITVSSTAGRPSRSLVSWLDMTLLICLELTLSLLHDLQSEFAITSRTLGRCSLLLDLASGLYLDYFNAVCVVCLTHNLSTTIISHSFHAQLASKFSMVIST